MSDVKQPADHKAKPTPYKFEGADGKTYSLPFASKGREKITGRDMRDALMDGDAGKMKLGFLLLEACGAKVDAVDAIYDRPNNETIEILGEWMTHGDGDGASLGKS
jgi:hypothetical protein